MTAKQRTGTSGESISYLQPKRRSTRRDTVGRRGYHLCTISFKNINFNHSCIKKVRWMVLVKTC